MKISQTLITLIALVTTGSLGAACYTVNVIQCAWLNSTTCTKVVTCEGSTTEVTALAAQDAYVYPAANLTQGTGVDKTQSAMGCTYCATYTDPCSGMPIMTQCGPGQAYTTVDYDGNTCIVGE